MNYQEEALVFTCAEENLLGILSVPEETTHTGVVIVVGGPQYRVGSHRQFVLLARALASAGYAVLRFDYRGMGDSSGDARDFLGATEDISAAINAMQERLPDVQKIALWGLCDGASAALLYCHQTHDTRIRGLCLLNPWIRSDTSLARTQIKHYYVKRLLQRDFWQKFISGKVAFGALAGLFKNLHLSIQPTEINTDSGSFQEKMAKSWTNFSGSILLILSENDYTAKEFTEYIKSNPKWNGALKASSPMKHQIENADHTFSERGSALKVEVITRTWLKSCIFQD